MRQPPPVEVVGVHGVARQSPSLACVSSRPSEMSFGVRTMLGWMIIIAAQTLDERDASDTDRDAAELARWKTSVGGMQWLDKLVVEGKAKCPPSAGYPRRYFAKAGDVLPILADGIPDHHDTPILGDDYIMPANWKGDVTFRHDRIAACPPDQVLTIDAWDLS